mgnify:CR=1 FL=1
MSKTVSDIFDITMDLIDERLDTGLLSEEDTISYQVKTPGLLNALQNELIKIGEYYSTHEIDVFPIEPMLGSFNFHEYNSSDLSFEVGGSVKSYYFEVNGPGTVYIEDFTSSWNTLETVTVPVTVTNYTAYSGSVTPTSGATKSRIRFSGTYYYNFTNFALYSQTFYTVPAYRPWIQKDMPSDFKSVDQIVKEYEYQRYERDGIFRWEGRNKLFVSHDYKGKIRITYVPVLDTLTALTDTLQLDDTTCVQVLPYGLAALLLVHENPDIANYMSQRFDELKFVARKKAPSAFHEIEDVYTSKNSW